MDMRLIVPTFIVCLLAVFAQLAAAGGVPESESLEFPYLLRIAPGNVLFVYGHEFRGDVVISWDPADSLRIGGLPVHPRPALPPAVLPEERLAEVFGDVPFVADMVQEGSTWNDAVLAWDREAARIRNKIYRTYRTVLDSTGSRKAAEAAVLQNLDRSLFEPGIEPKFGVNDVKIKWAGLSYCYVGLEAPIGSGSERRFTPKEKGLGYIRNLIKSLDGRRGRGWLWVVNRSGDTALTGAVYEEALRQIEEAEKGNLIEGPLDEDEVREIIDKKEGTR
jgi:hypothetical protein